MMLEFIFKYTWVAMLLVVYIIWGASSIKDIVHTKRVWKDEFDIDILDESSIAWIIITLGAIFAASFIYCLFGGAE